MKLATEQFFILFNFRTNRYLHEKNDETYEIRDHSLTGMQEMAERIVRYDLDDQDVTWLELVNEDRADMGKTIFTFRRNFH